MPPDRFANGARGSDRSGDGAAGPVGYRQVARPAARPITRGTATENKKRHVVSYSPMACWQACGRSDCFVKSAKFTKLGIPSANLWKHFRSSRVPLRHRQRAEPARVVGRAGSRCARDGPAKRLAGAFGKLHPALVFVVTMLAGLAQWRGSRFALGALVTRVLEPAWGIGAADERVNVWLAAHRTTVADACFRCLVRPRRRSCLADRGRDVRDRVSGVSQMVGRRFFRVRPRRRVGVPTGRRRSSFTHIARGSSGSSNLPVNASYPSGHTAASVAVYGGLALLADVKIHE